MLTEIEFLEFVSTHLTDDAPVDTSEELLAAFRVFDKDNNGFITRVRFYMQAVTVCSFL
jgi:Ca2+-binding EF-hand superfamily protein